MTEPMGDAVDGDGVEVGASLPAGWLIRRPTPADLDAVAELVTASDLVDFGEPDYTPEDLASDWEDLDLAVDAWVVEADGGRLVGYGATRDHGDRHVVIEADGYVEPARTGRGVGTALVRVMEARAREHLALAPEGARVVVHQLTNAADANAARLLTAEGYAPIRHFWRMIVDLDPDNPPPAPAWPEGIDVRACAAPPVDAGTEAARSRREPDPDAWAASEPARRLAYLAVDEAFRDHWGSLPRPFEAWSTRQARQLPDPSLWFLAEDVGGGEVAGALVGGYRDGHGWVGSLAVRRPWRGRGLGAALLAHAFGELWRRGTVRVGLGVDAQNPTGATRLYERAGMSVARAYAIHEKELRPGEDLSEPKEG